MLIEFNFGPHAGQSEHIPDTAVAALLVKAGVLKLIQETAPNSGHPANAASAKFLSSPEAAATWGAGLSPIGDPVITLKAHGGRTELFFTGKPEWATGHFIHAGFDLPKDILDNYTALYNRPDPEALAEARRNAGQR
jgi:hypothetical protein